eukprot:4579158-Pyramimonas_sp.AAC.1
MFGSFLDAEIAGGVAIMVRDRNACQFQGLQVPEVVAGRILVVRLLGQAGDLQLANMHLDPSESHTFLKHQMIATARAALGNAEATASLAGDSNFCAGGEGRLR